jgi:hypothetical protein
VSCKILYIAGCGRSGTTILGFVFGNMARAVDLGEVLDVIKFKGRPNGFGPETPNHQFWEGVIRDVQEELGGLDYVKLAALQSRLDTHWAVLKLRLGWRPPAAELTEYRRFLRVLYDRLQADERFDVLIDSSKYPSRLDHLRHIYPDDRVRVLHVVRDPIDLARAFRNPEQSQPKSFGETLLYAFAVNTLVAWVSRGLGCGRYVRMQYEAFVARPEHQVRQVADAFGLDALQAIHRISAGEPLLRGFIFNGNRMRTQATVRLERRAPVSLPERSLVQRCITRLFSRLFGSSMTSV